MVTHNIHVALIEDCRKIAIEKGYAHKSRISISDLLDYRARIKHNLERDQQSLLYHIWVRWLGFRNRHEQLSRVLDRAVALVETTQHENHHDFHYMDFNVSIVGWLE